MANNLEEAWPDPQYDRQAFEQRLDRYVAQQNAKLAGQGSQTAVMHDFMLDSAVGRVEEAVRQYAPWIEEFLQHPEFAPALRSALQSASPQQWRDPRFLASAAGAVVPALPRGTGRSSISFQQPRHESGRQQEAEYTDVDRLLAEREGISLEVAAAADDPTGERLRRARAQQARRRSGRR